MNSSIMSMMIGRMTVFLIVIGLIWETSTILIKYLGNEFCLPTLSTKCLCLPKRYLRLFSCSLKTLTMYFEHFILTSYDVAEAMTPYLDMILAVMQMNFYLHLQMLLVALHSQFLCQ